MSLLRLGSIVLYHEPNDPDGAPRPDCPAIVQAIHEADVVTLWVFGTFDMHNPHRVAKGDEPGQWSEAN